MNHLIEGRYGRISYGIYQSFRKQEAPLARPFPTKTWVKMVPVEEHSDQVALISKYNEMLILGPKGIEGDGHLKKDLNLKRSKGKINDVATFGSLTVEAHKCSVIFRDGEKTLSLNGGGYSLVSFSKSGKLFLYRDGSITIFDGNDPEAKSHLIDRSRILLIIRRVVVVAALMFCGGFIARYFAQNSPYKTAIITVVALSLLAASIYWHIQAKVID